MRAIFYKFVKNQAPLFQLFNKYKSVLKFILIFLGSYCIFSVLYNWYLDFSIYHTYNPDYITYMVSKQTEAVIDFFGYSSRIFAEEGDPSVKLFVNNQFLASIVEGCNSVSVIILFISFVLAFFSKFRITALFMLAGCAIIYAMNIIRIAILAIGIYEYPGYTNFLHSIVFPLIIYGTVFLLWIIWVRIFSKSAGNEGTI